MIHILLLPLNSCYYDPISSGFTLLTCRRKHEWLWILAPLMFILSDILERPQAEDALTGQTHSCKYAFTHFICLFLLLCSEGKKPELRKTHSRHLVTQQGLIYFTYYHTLFTWHIVTYSLMAQRVVDDYNFIADVWKIMTDKVSIMLSYFFCFYFTFLINNS